MVPIPAPPTDASLARPLWHDAAAFAAWAHRGQIRKDGRTPYAAHPARGALIVALHFGVTDPATLATAYLHDVIEDCDVDYDDVEEAFGREVAGYVAALSKDTRLPESEREAAYDRQLAAAQWPARLVKLADALDNLEDALDGNMIGKRLDVARRVLAIAAGVPELESASAILRTKVEAAAETA